MRAERPGATRAWSEQAGMRRAEKATSSSDDSVDEVPTTTLRAARASGVFLHEVLERVPIASFASAKMLDPWRALAGVKALFDEAMAAHRVDPEQRDDAERLVWTAYRTPVTLPGGERLEGFASGTTPVREMEFVYPIPDGRRTRVEAGAPIGVARGYVRGSLDLAFEHGGLTYFVDWKSDSLASYARDELGRHVATHYVEQARLYTLAIVKLLDIRTKARHEARFGGLLYCFLRGFDGAGDGVWSERPSWDDVLAWDENLGGRGRTGAWRR